MLRFITVLGSSSTLYLHGAARTCARPGAHAVQVLHHIHVSAVHLYLLLSTRDGDLPRDPPQLVGLVELPVVLVNAHGHGRFWDKWTLLLTVPLLLPLARVPGRGELRTLSVLRLGALGLEARGVDGEVGRLQDSCRLHARTIISVQE